MRIAGILDKLDRVKQGAVDAYGEGRDDRYVAYKRGRKGQGLEEEGPRLQTTLGTNRTLTMLRDLVGASDPAQRKARDDMGMGLSSDPWKKSGQVLGHIGNDLTEDTSRAIWWLLNAPQATANVLNEELLHLANPQLFNSRDVMQREGGGNITFNTKKGNADHEEAVKRGMMSTGGELTKGYRQANIGGENVITKRKYDPGHVSSLAIPAGLAMNVGLGLMTPFGGAEGYKAAIPNEEDPTKTDNVLGEIAAKYVLGRTGNLLPWDEFKQVRPDVSKDEYMRYKAFKFDNDEDWNPTDGDTSMLMGALKGTDEGIHGPEIQFLGRSIPVTTGIVPTASAMLGTALGVRNKRAPIRTGFGGGLAGLAAGQVTGNLLEQERRRRNAAANELDRVDTID